MASDLSYIEYVCEQAAGTGSVRYRKMFGEYMVYIEDKPLLLICNNIVYVKKLDCILQLMEEAESGFPYVGAKEHYILDIDSRDLTAEVIAKMLEVTPLPKRKK